MSALPQAMLFVNTCSKIISFSVSWKLYCTTALIPHLCFPPGLPAIKFPWFFFSSMMEVQAQLCINAKTTVIVHLYNLSKKKKVVLFAQGLHL